MSLIDFVRNKMRMSHVYQPVLLKSLLENKGEDAGQTIFHCHIHLIPRRKGDVVEPRGGVRNIISGTRKY